MFRSNLNRSILVLAFVIVLAACSSASTNQMPSAPTAPQKSSITLEPCTLNGISALCGTLKVYEDRAARSGRMIDLHVAVVKAKTP